MSVMDNYVLLTTFERTIRAFCSIKIFAKRLRIRDARSILVRWSDGGNLKMRNSGNQGRFLPWFCIMHFWRLEFSLSYPRFPILKSSISECRTKIDLEPRVFYIFSKFLMLRKALSVLSNLGNNT